MERVWVGYVQYYTILYEEFERPLILVPTGSHGISVLWIPGENFILKKSREFNAKFFFPSLLRSSWMHLLQLWTADTFMRHLCPEKLAWVLGAKALENKIKSYPCHMTSHCANLRPSPEFPDKPSYSHYHADSLVHLNPMLWEYRRSHYRHSSSEHIIGLFLS